MTKGWGGPGRGGGAYPRDIDAALEKAIATLGRRLAVAQERSGMPFHGRQEIFRRIDELQEQAEIFLASAPDYPGEK